VGKPVYLKLDALQASGSFKDRGMAHLCATFEKEGVTELISSSGGNAGLAVATVGGQLGMSVSVIVPETTKPLVIAKLESLGAHVTVHGENWNAADTLARERVKANPNAKYVSPYDNPLLWTGHSSLVDEVLEQLGGDKPGAIVVSVGGGGLLCGVLEGCARQQLLETKVIASETEGASSFGQAWEKGEVVILPGIDSIATSLGATSVTPVALDRAREHQGGLAAAICTDAEAVDACVKFAQDHRMLVEPACGAALAVAYSERLREKYLKDVKNGPIVLEVCGGSGVNVDLLHSWKNEHL
jgi:L-serine/L-threonine ammonia-lyase